MNAGQWFILLNQWVTLRGPLLGNGAAWREDSDCEVKDGGVFVWSRTDLWGDVLLQRTLHPAHVQHGCAGRPLPCWLLAQQQLSFEVMDHAHHLQQEAGHAHTLQRGRDAAKVWLPNFAIIAVHSIHKAHGQNSTHVKKHTIQNHRRKMKQYWGAERMNPLCQQMVRWTEEEEEEEEDLRMRAGQRH